MSKKRSVDTVDRMEAAKKYRQEQLENLAEVEMLDCEGNYLLIKLPYCDGTDYMDAYLIPGSQPELWDKIVKLVNECNHDQSAMLPRLCFIELGGLLESQELLGIKHVECNFSNTVRIINAKEVLTYSVS